MKRSLLLLMLVGSTGYANQLQSQNTNTDAQTVNAPATANATTGNQVVTVVVPPSPPPKVIVVTRTVYRTRVKRHRTNIYHYNPNRIQLLVGETKTKQEITTNACGCIMSATRVYQPDVGIQYLRDFGSFTGSVIYTQNQSFYLGVGFNW
jgi:hypothetical protein